MRVTSLALSASPALFSKSSSCHPYWLSRSHTRSAFHEILELQTALRSSDATLPHAAHTRLPYAAGGRGFSTAHASRGPRSCGTRSGQHAGRKNVCGVPRQFPRRSGSLAENRRNAFRFSGAHRMGNARRQTRNLRLKPGPASSGKSSVKPHAWNSDRNRHVASQKRSLFFSVVSRASTVSSVFSVV